MSSQQQQSGEGENYTNTLTEHHIQSAIEMGLQSRQQTYQEFMDSFIHLTSEDVKKYEEVKVKKELEKLNTASQADVCPDVHDQQQGKCVSFEGDEPMGNIKVQVESEDELETEELGEGTYSPRCTGVDKFGGGKKFVQVDNFVEDSVSLSDSDDDNIIEDEGGGGGYVASFGQVQDSSLEQNLRRDEEKSLEIDQENMDTEKDPEDEQRIVSPLPGEAVDLDEENISTPKNLIHQTQLDICVKIPPQGTHSPTSEEVEKEESSTNEVQPFSLDENFDYDNVVLSTKWDLHHRPPNFLQ